MISSTPPYEEARHWPPPQCRRWPELYVTRYRNISFACIIFSATKDGQSAVYHRRRRHEARQAAHEPLKVYDDDASLLCWLTLEYI